MHTLQTETPSTDSTQYTVHTAHTVHPVHPVHTLHPIHPVYPVHPVHPVHVVQTAHVVCTYVWTIYLCRWSTHIREPLGSLIPKVIPPPPPPPLGDFNATLIENANHCEGCALTLGNFLHTVHYKCVWKSFHYPVSQE